MKYLNKLLLTGILALTIPLFTSFNTNYTRIPLVKKLREIEQDKCLVDSVDCKHKTWKYNMNLLEAGYKYQLKVGWMNNSEGWHVYLRDEKGRVFDATWPNNPDGLIVEEGISRKDIYTFNWDATIEDYVYKKNYLKRDTAVIRQFVEMHPDYPQPKLSKEETIKRIKDYCKQDTSAWNYYQEHIAKNSK